MYSWSFGPVFFLFICLQIPLYSCVFHAPLLAPMNMSPAASSAGCSLILLALSAVIYSFCPSDFCCLACRTFFLLRLKQNLLRLDTRCSWSLVLVSFGGAVHLLLHFSFHRCAFVQSLLSVWLSAGLKCHKQFGRVLRSLCLENSQNLVY